MNKQTPCPKCGATPTTVKTKFLNATLWKSYCKNCGCGKESMYTTEQAAKDGWEKRVNK